MTNKLIVAERVLSLFARALAEAVDDGGSPGSLDFLDKRDGRVLARSRFAYPCTAKASFVDGSVTFATLTPEDGAEGRAKATWCVARDANGREVFEGNVGEAESGALVELEEGAFIRPGDRVSVRDFSLKLRQS